LNAESCAAAYASFTAQAFAFASEPVSASSELAESSVEDDVQAMAKLAMAALRRRRERFMAPGCCNVGARG